MLLGLAGLPGLPLPRLAQLARHLEFLADYSYAVYVFQFLCYDLWPTARVSTGFFVFLIGTAVMAVHAVQRPAQRAWSRLPGLACAALPVLWGLFLCGLALLPGATPPHVPPAVDLPALKTYSNGAIDWRLELSGARDAGERLINPSLLVRGRDLVVAARSHARSWAWEAGQYQGAPATIVTHVWHSDIVLGQAAFNGTWPPAVPVPVAKWEGLRTGAGGAWADLCVQENWFPKNATLVRKVTPLPRPGL